MAGPPRRRSPRPGSRRTPPRSTSCTSTSGSKGARPTSCASSSLRCGPLGGAWCSPSMTSRTRTCPGRTDTRGSSTSSSRPRDALVTLTPGAAEEVRRRWGRHGCGGAAPARGTAARDRHPPPAPSAEGGRPAPQEPAGQRDGAAGAALAGRGGRPSCRRRCCASTCTTEALDPAFPRYDAGLTQELRAAAASGALDLRVHGRFDDAGLVGVPAEPGRVGPGLRPWHPLGVAGAVPRPRHSRGGGTGRLPAPAAGPGRRSTCTIPVPLPRGWHGRWPGPRVCRDDGRPPGPTARHRPCAPRPVPAGGRRHRGGRSGSGHETSGAHA